MKDRPEISELLELSRNILRTELRSVLPEEHKYTVLMIANVISIALRERERKPDRRRTEAEEISQLLYDYKSNPENSVSATRNLDGMYGELSSAIRKGEFDPPGQGSAALRKFLLKWTEERVKLYNPGALD